MMRRECRIDVHEGNDIATIEIRGDLTASAQKDGLVPGPVSVIHRAPDGKLWFGTGGSHVVGRGIFLYDSNIGNGTPPSFINFTTRDGLAYNRVFDIQSSPDGVVWIATSGGVSRYDGKEFVNFTTEDGLANNDIYGIHGDPNGIVWFATHDGGSSSKGCH